MKSEVTYMHPSTIDMFSTQLPEQTFGTGSYASMCDPIEDQNSFGSNRPKSHNIPQGDRWEYRMESSPKLDKMGQEGWELCAVVPTASFNGLSEKEFYFKRKVL
jgi:hypothetical protein